MRRLMIGTMLFLGIFSTFALCACEEKPIKPDDTAHTHVYGEWTTDKEPTCTLAGEQSRTCACGEKETQPIPATGHEFSEEFTIDVEASCSTVGRRSKHCTHAGCTATQNVETIAKTEHVFGEWTDVKAATCTASGTQQRTCSNCTETETKDVDPLGHDFVGGKVTKEATCTEDGVQEGGICSRCQQEGKTEILKKLGHDYSGEEIVEKEPTCTEMGTLVVKCIRCDKTKKKNDIPALGHTWEVTKTDSSNVCGDVSTISTCANCNKTKTDIVEGEGHQWSDYTFYSGASCSAEGKRDIRTCSICGRDDFKVTAGSGRHFSGTLYYVYKEPTETSEGIRYKLCSTCGEIMNETRQTIPALKTTAENITYSVQVCRDITTKVEFNSEITVKVYEGSELKQTATTKNAIATFTLPAKNYTVKLEDLPEGYTAKKEEYTLTAAMPQINAEVSAAVISDTGVNSKGYYEQGDVVHDFTFTDYEGQSHTFSDLLKDHKFIVLDYYFTTCYYCNNEFTVEKQQGLDTRYGDDILFIYVNGYGETKSKVDSHAKQYGLEGIFVNGTKSGSNNDNFMVYFKNQNRSDWGFPTKIVVDQQGVYVSYSRGDTHGTMYITYESLLTMEKVCKEDLHMPEMYIPSDPETAGE